MHCDMLFEFMITPGTKFSQEIDKRVEWFLKYKLNTDKYYQSLKQVIFSPTSVPGEGEHKILNFIRTYRTSKDYDPNT
jgi:5'-3' exoribonuclease 2